MLKNNLCAIGKMYLAKKYRGQNVFIQNAKQPENHLKYVGTERVKSFAE